MKKIINITYMISLVVSAFLFVGYIIFLNLKRNDIIDVNLVEKYYSIIRIVLLGLIIINIINIVYTIKIFLPSFKAFSEGFNFYGFMGCIIAVAHLIEIVFYLQTAFLSNLLAY